jgi:uncharacterized lipoprotein YmbA
MKHLLLICPILLTGCLKFEAHQTYFDPESKTVLTNSVKASGFLKQTSIERIDVAARTKTTSKLVGARNTETSGDVEMVKAISDVIGQAFAAGAKSVKP